VELSVRSGGYDNAWPNTEPKIVTDHYYIYLLSLFVLATKAIRSGASIGIQSLEVRLIRIKRGNFVSVVMLWFFLAIRRRFGQLIVHSGGVVSLSVS
jgi:hypothetical protein